jgi:hypothetical protein
MASFQQVYYREEAIRLMRTAVDTAHSTVPEVKDSEDAHNWRKAYDAVVNTAPEEIRKLCHMLHCRKINIKNAMN